MVCKIPICGIVYLRTPLSLLARRICGKFPRRMPRRHCRSREARIEAPHRFARRLLPGQLHHALPRGRRVPDDAVRLQGPGRLRDQLRHTQGALPFSSGGRRADGGVFLKYGFAPKVRPREDTALMAYSLVNV